MQTERNYEWQPAAQPATEPGETNWNRVQDCLPMPDPLKCYHVCLESFVEPAGVQAFCRYYGDHQHRGWQLNGVYAWREMQAHPRPFTEKELAKMNKTQKQA